MSLPDAIRIAREVRQELRDTGDEFTVEDFRNAVAVACAHLAQTALEGLVAAVVKQIDREATHTRPREQMLLFDLEDDYALGQGRRIARRSARLDHMQEMLALDDRNRQAVDRANDLKHEEFDRLLPYWSEGMTKAEAVEAWRAANDTGEELESA